MLRGSRKPPKPPQPAKPAGRRKSADPSTKPSPSTQDIAAPTDAAPEAAEPAHSTRPRRPTTGRNISRAQAYAPKGQGPQRPSVLSPEVERRLLDAASVGATHEVMARYAGIASSTLTYWKQKASRGVKKYAELIDKLHEAEAKAELENLGTIQQIGKKDRQWTALAWYLERKYPDRYAKRDALVVNQSGAIKVIVEHVADWHARDVIDVSPAGETDREQPRRSAGRPRMLRPGDADREE